MTAPDDAADRDVEVAGTDRAEEARRRRRQEVFGDVLPESTRDDRDEDRPGSGSTTGSGDGATDEWLKANVPPHHG